MEQLISLEENKLKYPIIIEVPENYWTYSTNKIEKKEEE
tara:strand:+ start:233 stop:349 length:117 start_codon:yes stop_codon:yes gene_type:complete